MYLISMALSRRNDWDFPLAVWLKRWPPTVLLGLASHHPGTREPPHIA